MAAACRGSSCGPIRSAAFGSASAEVLDGDRFNFDHQIRMRQPSHLDGGAGRKTYAQKVVADVDVLKELVDVGHKCCGFYEIGECNAGSLSAARIFSPTWRICARMSRGPTMFPDLSRASCPEMKMSDWVSATTTCVYRTRPSSAR